MDESFAMTNKLGTNDTKFKRQRDIAWWYISKVDGISYKAICDFYSDKFNEKCFPSIICESLKNINENFLKKEGTSK